MFFWLRGGKEYVKRAKRYFDLIGNIMKYPAIEEIIEYSKRNTQATRNNALIARDFLDALACLGEEKVKELIKVLK